jgi:hypothetical protein
MDAVMTRTDAERIESWVLDLTMAGYTREEAEAIVAAAERDRQAIAA